MGIEELAKVKKELSTGEDLLVEEQQQPGPFLLEHFDSSEGEDLLVEDYCPRLLKPFGHFDSLAVPGEGTRPEVLIMPMRGIFLSLPITFPLIKIKRWSPLGLMV